MPHHPHTGRLKGDAGEGDHHEKANVELANRAAAQAQGDARQGGA